jgi:hypothetical protein
MITYKRLAHQTWCRLAVHLDGRRVGTIRGDTSGFHYQPKGSTSRGADFRTLEACKRSIEGAD